MSDEKPLNVYLIAGEASGDLLGAYLMRSLKSQTTRPIVFHGIGGERMMAEGLTSLFPYYELSMMGFFEVVPYIFRTLKHIANTVADIKSKQPDVVITIDSPGFCFRVVEKLRAEKVKTKFVHYVAPTVWAYKPERAEKCAKLFDAMLVLLPFEPPYFTKLGLDCTYVGHSIVSEITVGNGAEFRTKYEIPDRATIFCLLPGSRGGEVKRLMPVFAKAVAMLSSCYPSITLVIAVPEHTRDFLAPYLNDCPFPVILTEDDEDKRNGIAASEFAFVKSGTVAFEVAMAAVPMLISYKMNKLSVWFLRRMVKIKYANLINILLGKEVIPELLQERAMPIMLASCANTMLSMPEVHARQKENIRNAIATLLPNDGSNPSDNAARKILSLL